jgi:nucleoside-diphosphate-sugar epimerase
MNRIIEKIDISDFKNKNILITGANGLIGGFLADFFHYLNTELDFNIKLVLSSLSKHPFRIENILNKPNVTYISVDLSSTGVICDIDIDYCFYCAGYAQPSKFMANPLDTIGINTIGLFKTLNSVFRNKNAKCIYLSSSEIYSANLKDGSHMETDLINVDIENKRNPYILGKICGESIINNFADIGLNSISARVSLCYGPGVLPDDTRVLSEIVHKGFSKSTTIDLFDDGSASRRYIHISDFVIMILNLILKGNQRVYNICGEEECTIHELATIIGNKLNKKVNKGKSNDIVSKTAPKIVWNSLERYNMEFGKMEFKPLVEGIDEFLEWYKKTNNI